MDTYVLARASAGSPREQLYFLGDINCPQLPKTPSQKALLRVGSQGGFGHEEVAVGRHMEQQQTLHRWAGLKAHLS